MKIKTLVISCIVCLIIGCQARIDLQDMGALSEMEASIAASQKNNELQFAMMQSQIDALREQINTNFYICVALFITLFLCFFVLMILLYVEKRNQNRFLQSLILKNNGEARAELLK